MATPEIRKFTIPPRGPVFKPTREDPDSAIVEAIKNGEIVTASDNFRLTAVPATAPHSVGYSIVLWADEMSPPGTARPWDDTNWERIAQDSAFLTGVETYVERFRTDHPDARCYLFIGYIQPETEVQPGVYTRALQSQRHMHIHIAQGYAMDSKHNGFLDLLKDQDRKHFNIFLNRSGEVSIALHEQDLASFGEPIAYRQVIGVENQHVLSRTMFGFSSLQEAFLQTLELRSRIYATWLHHALSITEYSEEYAGVVLHLMQTAVPCFSIILPSEDDKKNGNVTSDARVWVMPFAIYGGQGVLTPGGGVINRLGNSGKK